jgi:hypothetical protein
MSPWHANAADERKFKRVNVLDIIGSLRVDMTDTLTSNREAAKAPFLFQLSSFTDRCVWRHNHWIEDEAVLVSFDFSDHIGLLFD